MSIEINSAPEGFIYVMHCAAHEPHLYKVGATTLQPEHRARQLSASTAAPTPFVVAYKKHVAFPFQAEANIHRILDKYRVHDSREFFLAPLHVIIAEFDRFDSVAENRPSTPGTEYPFAELFACFKDDGSPRELTAHERKLCADLADHIAAGRPIH